MTTVALSESTYKLLQSRAQEKAQTPDQVADNLLRQQLAPNHPYIEIAERPGGLSAILRGSRISVRDIIGYIRIGETPESLAQNILPHLSLAQVYDALSYYYDHKAEIEKEMAENTEEHWRTYMRERLGEEGYLRVTGQKK